MAQPRDPFYAVKDKVQAALQDLHESLSRAEKLLTSGGSAGEIEPMLTAARVDMSQIHVDVKDLSQTITIVEENRPRFPSIDNRELDSRRGFVTDAKTSLSQYDEHIKRLQHRVAVGPGNQRKNLLNSSAAGASRFQSSANEEATRGNDDFVQQSRMSAHRQTEEEDKVLIDMSHALERLQGIGQTINSQLVEQDAQLSALGEDMDTAQSSMNRALQKMDKLLKSSDKGRLCLIVCLFFLAIGLFFGIVYG